MKQNIYQQDINKPACKSVLYVKGNAFGLILTMLICLLFFISACKKEKDQEQLPEFGTCTSAEIKGKLTFNSSTGAYTFRTNGGGTIVLNSTSINISHDDYTGFSIELWGGLIVNGQSKEAYNLENLNGKHVKDKISNRRTIIFPDGAKITIIAEDLASEALSISIYDGAESHHLNLNCSTNKLEWSSASSTFTQQLDNTEADGEAGGFRFTATGLVYDDYYIEEVAGNKVTDTIPIGEIYRATPDRVNDYWP